MTASAPSVEFQIMATKSGKGEPSGLSNLGRGVRRQPSIPEASQSSYVDNLDESTPLTDPKAVFDFSHILGIQKLPKEVTADASNNGSERRSWRHKRTHSKSPEDRIKLFAFRLAFLEKAASGIGTLAFVWATVILLGGFASTLTKSNFWVVAVIIFADFLRIFNRSHELEWHLFSSKPKSTTSMTSSDSGDSARYSSIGDVESSSTPGFDDAPISSTRPFFSPFDFSKTSRTGGEQGTGGQRQQARVSGPVHNDEPQTTPTLSRRERKSGPVHNGEPQTTPTLSRRDISMISSSVPVVNHLLKPRVMILILYILQLASAVVCVAVSIWRLSQQDFCANDPDEKENNKAGILVPKLLCKAYEWNVVISVNLFYCMAILDAVLFLVEKGYFEYRMTYGKLLRKASTELFGEKFDHTVFEKYFYTVFNICLKGSIFYGLDMSLVVFGIKWLQSDDFDEQLNGAKLLNGFVSAKGEDNYIQDNSQAAEAATDALRSLHTKDALRRLGTTPGIIERLVEMLSWNAAKEEELVSEIAGIVCALVGYDHNWSRFTAVPGALDAVVSLLMPHAGNFSVGGTNLSMEVSKVLNLQVKGLKILRYLCTSYSNSLEIGETRGLLPILVLFIQAQGRTRNCKGPEHKVYKKSLQVLYYLAANKGTSGKALRQHIAGIVSVLKNLRDVIDDHDADSYLQLLSMKILHYLALEENVRCSIGATGGIIRSLFGHFRRNDAVLVPRELEKFHYAHAFNNEGSENHEKGRNLDQDLMEWSGKVLSRLMLQNKDNCLTLLTLKDGDGNRPMVDVMIASLFGRERIAANATVILHLSAIATSAAEILRSVLKYADDVTRMKIAELSAPIVLQNISNLLVTDTKSEMYEASLGLASRAMESLPLVKYRETLSSQNQFEFMLQLIKNLRHSPTTSKVPKIRRYSVEAIIALVERDEYFEYFGNVRFVRFGLKEELEYTLDSISEVENFNLLSGLLGYSRYNEDIKCLVLRCMAAVDRRLGSEATWSTSGTAAA